MITTSGGCAGRARPPPAPDRPGAAPVSAARPSPAGRSHRPVIAGGWHSWQARPVEILRTPDDRFDGLPVARLAAANTGLPTGDQPMPEVWWQFRRVVEHASELDVARLVQAGCRHTLAPGVRAGYDAPFPDARYQAGPRAMPVLVPTAPDDPATAANRAAWAALTTATTPLL